MGWNYMNGGFYRLKFKGVGIFVKYKDRYSDKSSTYVRHHYIYGTGSYRFFVLTIEGNEKIGYQGHRFPNYEECKGIAYGNHKRHGDYERGKQEPGEHCPLRRILSFHIAYRIYGGWYRYQGYGKKKKYRKRI
jgi:hypothetical protein